MQRFRPLAQSPDGGLEFPLQPETDVEGVVDTYDSGDELRDTADILDIISKFLDLSKLICDQYMAQQLRDQLTDAQKSVEAGQRKMEDAYRSMAEARLNYDVASNNATTIGDQILGLRQQAERSLATLGSLSSQITNIEAGIQATQRQITSMQADLSQLRAPASRSKYPAGSAGLSQWRADQQALQSKIFSSQKNIADVKKSQDAMKVEANNAKASADSYASRMEPLKGQYDSQRALADSYKQTILLNGELYNSGFTEAQDGARKAQEAVADFQACVQEYGIPMIEASSGSKRLADALRKFADNKNFAGAADILSGGLESAIRNAGNRALSTFGPYGPLVLAAAGDALDRGIQAGKSYDEIMLDFGIAVGNTTIGLEYWFRFADSVELSAAIMENSSNPNAVRDGMREVSENTLPNLILGTGRTLLTIAPAVGAGPAVPAGELVLKGIAIGSSGLLRTMVEASGVPISTPLTPGEYQPLPIVPGGGWSDSSGRPRLFTPPPGFGSQPSLGTYLGAATTLTLYTAGSESLLGAIRENPQAVAQLNGAIEQMARAGWMRDIPLRANDITIRPGVIPPSVITGD